MPEITLVGGPMDGEELMLPVVVWQYIVPYNPDPAPIDIESPWTPAIAYTMLTYFVGEEYEPGKWFYYWDGEEEEDK